MPPAKAALKREPAVTANPGTRSQIVTADRKALPDSFARQQATAAEIESRKLRPVGVTSPPKPRRENGYHFQSRVPVLVGEAIYRGWMPVDGIISGQLGAN